MKKLSIFALALVMIVSAFVILTPTAKAGNPTDNGTQSQEAKKTEDNQKRLAAATPIPELQQSLERENLKRRLEFQNDANRPGYVYMLSDTGQVIAEYVIKGKPSSMNSLLTTPQQLVTKWGGQCSASNYSGECYAVDSPDLDGSYGANPDGIFFFTADNTYVEWAGRYIYSSERLNIKTPVSLTRPVAQ